MRDRIIFSNNQQVSARQISRALFLEMLGISTLLLPPALARLCGTDGVFAILFGGVLTYLLSVVWNRYSTNVKQNNTSEQYRNTKVLECAIKIVYISAFLGIPRHALPNRKNKILPLFHRNESGGLYKEPHAAAVIPPLPEGGYKWYLFQTHFCPSGNKSFPYVSLLLSISIRIIYYFSRIRSFYFTTSSSICKTHIEHTQNLMYDSGLHKLI